MAIISDADQARRLARAIAADLRLYNEAKIQAGADLSAELAEARELFQSRVAPALLHVFEEEASKLGAPATSASPAPSTIAAAGKPPSPFASFYEQTAVTPATSGARVPLLVGLLVAAVAIVVAVLLR